MNSLNYDIVLDTISSGFDGTTCWVHPRVGCIPGSPPVVVLIMQKLLLSGSDVFFACNEMHTRDHGKTWSVPVRHESLGRRPVDENVEVGICDFSPRWHPISGRLIGVGHTVYYRDDKEPVGGHTGKYHRNTAFSVYDPDDASWTQWKEIEMPDSKAFVNCSGSGCGQYIDLPEGDILNPAALKTESEERYSSAVMRWSFNGEKLSCNETGNSLTVDIGRGLYEPSLTFFNGYYFLTLRNDESGYVTSSDDWHDFSPPRKWCFDDGTDLGNYNTQQHWVTHSDRLFLVYTRRSGNNDHVFRHRAPLYMAEVDPEKLCVIQETERILIPERGARLGNFGVTVIDRNETWVTVAEWMQPAGCEKYGSDNSVYIARIKWDKPNRLIQE